MARATSLLATVVLVVGLAGCDFFRASPGMNESGVPTFGNPSLGCAGVGLQGPMIVRIDPASRPSVHVDWAGARQPYWPSGTTVRTAPDVALIDDRGQVIARDGQSFESGAACVTGDDSVVISQLGDWNLISR